MSKIIKCMFFVLLAAVLPLSVHAQQVTLHLQDVTVRKAFRELEVKGNVSLVYEKNDVDLTRKVTVKVDNQPISKALDQILKGQELIYKIKDNHIIITRPVVQKSDKKRRTLNGFVELLVMRSQHIIYHEPKRIQDIGLSGSIGAVNHGRL